MHRLQESFWVCSRLPPDSLGRVLLGAEAVHVADVPMSTEATLRGYEGEGLFIVTIKPNGVCLNIETLIGIDAGVERISYVDLDYDDATTGETMDDLLFEQRRMVTGGE